MNEQKKYEALSQSLAQNGTLPYAGRLLERAATLWPERTALIYENKSLSYRELFEDALKCTAFLESQGIAKHDRIILLWENSSNFYRAYFGIWQCGAVVAPVNTMLHAKEIAAIIQHAQPRAIVASRALYEKIKDITNIPLITEDALEQCLHNNVPNTRSIQELDEHESAVLLYTSGTTGTPKGVMLSSHNIMVNCLQGYARAIVEGTERVLAALPLFHSYMQNTCIWSLCFVGATAIIVPRIERKAILEGLSHHPTIVLGIPQLYGLFCLMKTAPFEYVRYFVSGGDALPDKIRMAFELIYRRKICNGYGLTETAPFLTIELDDIIVPTSTIGTPFYGIEVQIRNESGAILPQGTPGTLWVKGENIMLGYYKAPELTEEVIQNGWFNTGDIAVVTRDGSIVLCGREKDLIKSKGIKVYPQEIENILMLHPQIIGAAVIGEWREDEEVPVAYVAAKDPAYPNLAEELRELCANHLASYEVPRSFIIRASLPMTATGKVNKKQLKAEHQ